MRKKPVKILNLPDDKLDRIIENASVSEAFVKGLMFAIQPKECRELQAMMNTLHEYKMLAWTSKYGSIG